MTHTHAHKHTHTHTHTRTRARTRTPCNVQSLASCGSGVHTLEVLACDDAGMSPEDLASIAKAPCAITPETKDGGSGVLTLRA